MASDLKDVMHFFKYPIKLVKWKVSVGSHISVGSILFLYQEFKDNQSNACTHKFRARSVGTVHELCAQVDSVIKERDVILQLASCKHPTVMKDLCAECGADLRFVQDEVVAEPIQASVSMIHSVPELKVSQELAMQIGRADEDRLIKANKLVLLVDLDQTLVHTTNDNIPNNIKDVHHFQLYGPNSPWYHTRLRPGTMQFLENISKLYELHICTFGVRSYAHMIASILDADGKYFAQRILSRDECCSPSCKTANLKALFPCGDSMVCIIDDREDVWNYSLNLIPVKPYHFFQHTGDINAPPGLDKTEQDSDDEEDNLLSRVIKSALNRKMTSNNISNSLSKNGNEKINMPVLDSLETSKSQDDTHQDATDSKNCGENMKLLPTNNGHTAENNMNTDSLKSDELLDIVMVDKTNENCEAPTNNLKTNENLFVSVESTYNGNKKIILLSEESSAKVPNESNPQEKLEPSSSDSVGKAPSKISCEESITLEAKQDTSNNNDEPMKAGSVDCNKIFENYKKQFAKTEKFKNIDKEMPTKQDIQSTNGDKLKNKKALKPSIESDLENNESKCLSDEQKSVEDDDKTKSLISADAPDGMIEIEDNDDYLLYLEDILNVIHKAYYKMYDQTNRAKKPDLKNVVPYVRLKVLKSVNIVFSGIIPTNMNIERNKAYNVAKSLGATVQQKFISHEMASDPSEVTTHLIAAHHGTVKVKEAKKIKGIHIVCIDWLWNCSERWEHVDERLFPLNNFSSSSARNSPICRRSPSSDINRKSGNMPQPKTEQVRYDPVTGKKIVKNPTSKVEEMSFASSYNPLLAFSSDDIADMDKEVEDLFNEESNGSESEVEQNNIEKKDDNSSSGESLSGDRPSGWKRKSSDRWKDFVMSSGDLEEEDQNVNRSSSDSDGEPRNKYNRIDNLGPDSDQSDFEGSVGSVDEEMAAAIEKELMDF